MSQICDITLQGYPHDSAVPAVTMSTFALLRVNSAKGLAMGAEMLSEAKHDKAILMTGLSS
jgi:hypothetical protein